MCDPEEGDNFGCRLDDGCHVGSSSPNGVAEVGTGVFAANKPCSDGPGDGERIYGCRGAVLAGSAGVQRSGGADIRAAGDGSGAVWCGTMASGSDADHEGGDAVDECLPGHALPPLASRALAAAQPHHEPRPPAVSPVDLESGPSPSSDDHSDASPGRPLGNCGSFDLGRQSAPSATNLNNNAKTDKGHNKKGKKGKKGKRGKGKSSQKGKKDKAEEKSIGVDTEYVIGLAAAFKYSEIGFVLGEGISAYMTECFSKHYGLYLTEYTKVTACFSFIVTLLLYFLMLCRMPDRYPYSCTILHRHYVFSFFAFITNAVASVLNGVLLCDKPRYFMMGFGAAAALAYMIDGSITYVALKNKQKDKLARALNRKW